MISGARERDQWHEMGQARVFKESRAKNIKFWQKEDRVTDRMESSENGGDNF